MANDSLEKLKKKLFGLNSGKDLRAEQDTLGELRSYAPKKESPTSWAPGEIKPRRELTPLLKLALGLAAFTLAAIIVAVVYLFGGFGGGNGGKDVALSMASPDSVAGGDRVVWRVTIENKSALAVNASDLVFEYPAGSRPLSKQAKTPLSALLIERRTVGKIAPGETLTQDFEAFVFGDAESLQEAHVSIEYYLESSAALLSKEASSAVKITRTPVSVAVLLPQYANIGQDLELEVVATSEAKDKIEGVDVVVNYPDGFEFLSADPMPSIGNNIWNLKTFQPHEELRFKVKGRISGENLENKTFKASLGLSGQKPEQFVSYGAGVGNIALRRPFLDVVGLIDGDKEAIAAPGDTVNLIVAWTNNLPVAIKNATVEVKLSGAAVDWSRVIVPQGFFRGSDRTVVWNASSYPQFADIAPGASGELRVGFSILRSLPINGPEDINYKVLADGRMYLGANPAGFEGVDLEGKFSASVKISSSLQFSRQGYYYHDKIVNSGPVPPKVGEKTTYTIVWSVSNSSNNTDNVELTATLPAYVSWEGVVVPTNEDVAFDATSGKLTWNIGKLPAGTGIIRPAREVAFKIGLIPSLDQVGNAPTLLSDMALAGKDLFTGADLKDSKGPLTTTLYSDTKLDYNQFTVVK
ncbi:MAG: hypothetical protein HZA25_01415 [Candidatus Niyogibacteria bacterium]|nr:hypothetical protein [Candidatus Niyogibacteria bacterium]